MITLKDLCELRTYASTWYIALYLKLVNIYPR